MSKPRIVKDYYKVEDHVLEQVKLAYPRGFEKHLVKFTGRDGRLVSALPFETEDKYYLLRMTIAEAQDIILDDDDYDEEGILKATSKEDFQTKFKVVIEDDEEEE